MDNTEFYELFYSNLEKEITNENFINSIKELMNNDALEAYYLSKLNTKKNNNIDPRLIFFILKTISVLNNTKVKNAVINPKNLPFPILICVFLLSINKSS